MGPAAGLMMGAAGRGDTAARRSRMVVASVTWPTLQQGQQGRCNQQQQAVCALTVDGVNH